MVLVVLVVRVVHVVLVVRVVLVVLVVRVVFVVVVVLVVLVVVVVVVVGVDLKSIAFNHVFDHRHGGQVREKAGMFEQDQLLRPKTKSRIGEHKGFEITFCMCQFTADIAR